MVNIIRETLSFTTHPDLNRDVLEFAEKLVAELANGYRPPLYGSYNQSQPATWSGLYSFAKNTFRGWLFILRRLCIA
jgi:hypothetical protein